MDLGSDTEWSDTGAGGNGGFDPGDIYNSFGSITPPAEPCGLDGIIDDEAFLGIDENPAVPECGTPRHAYGGIPDGGCGPAEICHLGYFDLDDYDTVNFDLSQFVYDYEPLYEPIPDWLFDQPNTCVHPPDYLRISYDDDGPASWADADYPAEVASAVGNTYGQSANQDEVVDAHLIPGFIAPYQVSSVTPWLAETDVHPDLTPNPDDAQFGIELYDDDVDGLDIYPQTIDAPPACEYLLFNVDHEANAGGYDPGDIILWHPLDGHLTTIDDEIHLGLWDQVETSITEDADVAAFEFVWYYQSEAAQNWLTVLFSVHPDDPTTPDIDESGGLDPRMIYASYMDGYYFEFLEEPLQDHVDAIAGWCSPATAEPDTTPPEIVWAAYLVGHGDNGIYGIDAVLGEPTGPLPTEPRTKGPETVYVGFSEPVTTLDGDPDPTDLALSTGSAQTFIIFGDETFGYGDGSNIGAFSGVPNGTCLTITLNNIVDLAGNPLSGPNSFTIEILHGDANGDGQVASGDITQVKSVSGQVTVFGNFRRDINGDGTIASGDITQVKSRSGNSGQCP
jgi:hypothetical protein